MSNYHTNKIYCTSKNFNLINAKELLNRYHEVPNYLDEEQKKIWYYDHKRVNFIDVTFDSNNLLVFITKNEPISYKIIEELSKDFKYCRYDWRNEYGYGKKLIFHKGKLQKECEYDVYTYNRTKEDNKTTKLQQLDLNKIEAKGTKAIDELTKHG